MCGNSSSSAVFNFCNNVPKQFTNIQQCNPISQPTPSVTALNYFTNQTGLVVNGSFTVVNTSTSSVFNVDYTTGVTTLTFVVTAGRSETIFVEDLRSITIESLTGVTPEANATGSLVLDLHYCVKCT
ncbi:hypothetical protein Back11_57200 [Paenibacillus baekrokdamisoli]|uniref:Uncharacterized protein n=1 Tax=Paenibacillus baekrokdamisoli TaxID=1712516 RepID=A0A3G9J7Q9_9BACL|nr:S-Ena type endospore appendage [Paenibacillus baekrokdamisoli]MBB3072813.1 hypothetical protein [Paenibacillus baekrokdamisoli]BBH24375.1 hypothetical protein Back11_57200 [Paenibacillus baekrokdamisoli]